MLLDELLQSIQPAMSGIGQAVGNGMNALTNMGSAPPTGMSPAPQPENPGMLGFLKNMDNEKMGMLGMALMSAGRGGSNMGALLPLLSMLNNKDEGLSPTTENTGDMPTNSNMPLMSRNMGRQPMMTREPMQVPANQPDSGIYSPNMQQLTGGAPIDKLMNSISSVESGGRYDAMGPRTKSGDRAFGRYQVMGNNIPSWTKNATGESLTPDQFLQNPQAQDAVARHYLGQYLDKYGNPQDAASMWFSGRPMRNNNSRDVTGTSVPQYVQRVTRHLQRY